ncbi:MAG: FeoA family protein [Deltaproteobacteria bacterium]
METRFSNLEPGDTGNVVGFTEGSASYRSKLLAMGLVPGVPFHVVRKAPLGDPIEIRVNGFHLCLRRICLRRKEAEMLRLKGYLQTLDTSFP